MKLTTLNKTLLIAACACMLLSVTSCVKEKFSLPIPAANVDPPGLYATMTLKQFKNYYCSNQNPTGNALNSITPILIPDSVILSGVINSDDRSGNLYKTLIFQDSTGGMQIVVDAPDLYNNYPVGTKVFVKCKGLYLYWYLGTLELGSFINNTGAQPALGGIPGPLLSTYVTKGMRMDSVAPRRMTLAQVNNLDALQDQSTLIQVDDVEITPVDTGKTYADAINQAFGSVNLIDCSAQNSLTIRSSGYANFATQKPAKGHGSALGIFTVYFKSSGAVNQLTIRDTTDVRLPLSTPRCH